MSKTLTRRLSAIILLASVAFVGTQCIPIPTVTEKAVELAVGSTITMEYVAEGIINTHDDTIIVNIADSLDIEEIVADAGIDTGDLIAITLTGVAYRVTEFDSNPNRQIVNGNVTVQRGAGTVTPLVTDFTEMVNTVTDWKAGPLDAAGVAVINDLLSDLVDEANGGSPATNVTATFHVTGDSEPSGDPTDFVWEIRLYFSIVGTIHVDMVDF